MLGLGLLLAAAFALSLLQASRRQAPAGPILIKFSHVVSVDSPKGKAAEYFKHRAEALTQGRVRVEIYPNSELYKDKEELEALQLG